MLKIAVIIINFNTSEYTIKCIESILKNTSETLSYKIYLVDNNSAPTDYFILKQYVTKLANDKVELHRSKINKGFGGGNMFGVQQAEPSEYIAFINNDTVFLNDCLSTMYNFMKSNPTVGITGGQSYDEDKKEIISFDHYASTTRQIFGRKFLETFAPSQHPKRKKSYHNPLNVNTVSGSLMVIDRQMFNEIGGFDENLFLYYEETDICLRLKNAKKSCFLIPSAKYIHYHGISTERSFNIKRELKISLIYLVEKHYGIISKKILLIYLILSCFFAAIIKPEKWALLLIYLQGAPLSKSLKTSQKIREF